MERFRFLLLDPDRSILAEQSHELPDLAAIWPFVEEMLKDKRAIPGHRISVRDSRNGIVASLGVSQAQWLFQRAA